ncbi:MAG: hypothetical protein AB8C84_13300 [Oligoflexales bacterium]
MLVQRCLVFCFLFISCGENRGSRSLSLEVESLKQCTGSFMYSGLSYSLYFEDDSQERWFACAQNIQPHHRGEGYQQPFFQKRYDEVDGDVFECELSIYGSGDNQLLARVEYVRQTGTASYEVLDQDAVSIANGDLQCKVRL